MSQQCVSKWVRRYREEGQAGLEDRSSRPRCSPTRTNPAVEERVLRAPMRKIAAPLPRYRTPRNSGASFF